MISFGLGGPWLEKRSGRTTRTETPCVATSRQGSTKERIREEEQKEKQLVFSLRFASGNEGIEGINDCFDFLNGTVWMPTVIHPGSEVCNCWNRPLKATRASTQGCNFESLITMSNFVWMAGFFLACAING